MFPKSELKRIKEKYIKQYLPDSSNKQSLEEHPAKKEV
jgi:vacuolar-type H+-ATPase subunit B/Vma2